MNSNVLIPQGEEKVTVVLTVKEAIALSGGVRFNEKDNRILSNAHRKVKQSLEQKLIPANTTIDYHALEV